MKRLIYFGHNRNDIACVRRIQSFLNCGLEVTAFTFRRDGESSKVFKEWSNIDLGYVEHAKFRVRILVFLKALGYIIKNRVIIKKADIIYARNLDIFMLAWFAKSLSPFSSATIIYECLDVHVALTKSNTMAKILRWIERRILNKCNLLVISSPGFLKNYFESLQSYRDNCFLVENKIYLGRSIELKRPSVNDITYGMERPIRLVWAGILRCSKTLDLMKAMANTMGKDIEIVLWGKISNFIIPDFEDQIKDIPNITYKGTYTWPQGLSTVYNGADLVWSQDLSRRSHNSDWLIPNRVYEGGYFATLSLALVGTQTGEIVSKRKLGYVIPSSNHDDIIEFINNLEKRDIYNKRIALLDMDKSDFIVVNEDVENLVEAISLSQRSQKYKCDQI